MRRLSSRLPTLTIKKHGQRPLHVTVRDHDGSVLTAIVSETGGPIMFRQGRGGFGALQPHDAWFGELVRGIGAVVHRYWPPALTPLHLVRKRR